MELITFGESMVLFNPGSKGPLRYVNNFYKTIAGAESNVAIGLARLGHEVGWFSKLGDDEFGRYIKATIRGEGVDVSRVRTDPQNNTGLIFKERFAHVNPNVYYYRKNSAAANITPEDLDEEYIKTAKILHLTGITPALSQSARETVFRAIQIAKDNGVLVSFDPNIRLKLWSVNEARPVLLKIAESADVIFPGIDEGKILLGMEKPEEIAKAFIDMGCKIIAIKLGKEGCYVANKDQGEYVAGYPVDEVEDTVGAGDGYAAGFLSGILRNLSLSECAQYANGVGAMATLVSGDMEGLPTYLQLLEFIGKTEHIDR
ncbi:MAG: 2-dehydro-3-deoxygluconokinase [Epulopiscium sp.]|uniref:Sugar kinase n=1 Tax=Defluviitalea raffinosedens TaxID=1450156 RepID=A0A7C8HER3_9FIRM|nr:sugar kinase [Defluviitalea raffinosedens]MBZ4667438.1 2-dehydro-3-deoxygluconokinase [Defluviitaleaceae bacterium]MDK2787565.1 2-dehydro-3-deoxygluconokinase [Candidatus Epulonipiscium sp.]KAE9634509.1 sugar kinase [Defluviitalea raffinosedens]MBM7684695.1 2-dehydro-3-deoxygluconokinase [Defluviitalea raffinosedens]HHW66925.1 sugar kinase [Candidatus Epulonipiscium sp.]